MKVILAGNPNTGKTTLFNTLTNSFEHASNWHGVTVDVKQKQYEYAGKKFEVCDLPGLYSLDAYSKEEKIASDFIEQNRDAVVVCILDANNLKRNLFLALELKEKTPNLIFAVNMAKEVKSFDAKKLEQELGVKTLAIDARKKKSAKTLKETIADFAIEQIVPNKTLEQFDMSDFEKKSKQKFQEIADLLNRIGYQQNGLYGKSKLDKIVLSKFGSFVIFALVMGLVFFITFGTIGNTFSEKVNDIFGVLSVKLYDFFQGFIKNELLLRFINEGVIAGALSVTSFLPQIILLFACLNLLEDFGYLSRVAFMFDPFFKRLGLTGRSAFSLIMGFGCTTTAIMTSRNLDNKNLQKRTSILLPFMSCSAKLPIFAVIASTFFAKYKALIVFSLYLFAILLMVVVALIFSKKDKEQEEQTFLLEMPKYRAPSLSKVLKNALTAGKNFIVRVGGAIVLSSVVIFMLYNFSFKFQYVGQNSENSVLYVLAKLLSWIFKPLGFGSVGATIAIFSGFVAKEMVVSSLAIVNKVPVDGLALSLASSSSAVWFSPISAISFLVFVLLYTPCVSACIMMKKENGRKAMWLSIGLQIGIAYLASFLVYNILSSIVKRQYGFLAGLLILVALAGFAVIKYLKKKNIKSVSACNGSCEACLKH